MLELHTTCKSLLSENECGQVKTIRNLKTDLKKKSCGLQLETCVMYTGA